MNSIRGGSRGPKLKLELDEKNALLQNQKSPDIQILHPPPKLPSTASPCCFHRGSQECHKRHRPSKE